MIECSDKNIWYIKRRKGKIKRFFVFFLLILIALSLFLYYKLLISNQIFAINQDYVKKYAIEAVNSAVINSLNEELYYNDLISIEKNSQGDIVLMNANSYKMNQLSRSIEKETTDCINKKLEE